MIGQANTLSNFYSDFSNKEQSGKQNLPGVVNWGSKDRDRKPRSRPTEPLPGVAKSMLLKCQQKISDSSTTLAATNSSQSQCHQSFTSVPSNSGFEVGRREGEVQDCFFNAESTDFETARKFSPPSTGAKMPTVQVLGIPEQEVSGQNADLSSTSARFLPSCQTSSSPRAYDAYTAEDTEKQLPSTSGQTTRPRKGVQPPTYWRQKQAISIATHLLRMKGAPSTTFAREKNLMSKKVAEILTSSDVAYKGDRHLRGPSQGMDNLNTKRTLQPKDNDVKRHVRVDRRCVEDKVDDIAKASDQLLQKIFKRLDENTEIKQPQSPSVIILPPTKISVGSSNAGRSNNRGPETLTNANVRSILRETVYSVTILSEIALKQHNACRRLLQKIDHTMAHIGCGKVL